MDMRIAMIFARSTAAAVLVWVGAIAIIEGGGSGCVQYCNVDSECDNGIWCDGEEFCDRRPLLSNAAISLLFIGNNTFKGGECSYNQGELPCCPEEHDCLGFDSPYYDIALQLCDDAAMQCKSGDECLTDSECDDGIWCTGVEACISGLCFNVLARCTGSETCNEEAMRCEETNTGACFRVLNLCPDPDRTSELAQIALVLGTSNIPENVNIYGNNVCGVPETSECDWPGYADCITENVTCGALDAGNPEDTLSACLDVFSGADCFVHLDGTTISIVP